MSRTGKESPGFSRGEERQVELLAAVRAKAAVAEQMRTAITR